MATAQAAGDIFDRMVRAARLDDAVYEEIEHDRDANVQAAIVVVLTTVTAAIGAGARLGPASLIVASLVGLGAWLLYAWLTYIIGTRLLRGPETSADWGEVARVLAFANAPSALLVLAAIGGGAIVFGIVGIWILFTTVVALRAALDFSTWRAFATAVLGWLAQGVLRALFTG